MCVVHDNDNPGDPSIPATDYRRNNSTTPASQCRSTLKSRRVGTAAVIWVVPCCYCSWSRL